MTEAEKQFPAKTRNKYLLIIAGLTLFNVFVYPPFMKTAGYSIKQNSWIVQDTMSSFKSAIDCYVFAIPILSFILGLFVALFPYCGLTYRKKYIRSSLLTWLSIDAIFSFMLIIIIFMTFAGWYPPKESVANAQTDKQQTITKFKAEMKSFCDSSTYYFDIALTEAESGKQLEDISEEVKSKILFFEGKIDARSKAFAPEATNAGLNQQEFDNVYKDISEYVKPSQEKYQKLKEKGIIIK